MSCVSACEEGKKKEKKRKTEKKKPTSNPWLLLASPPRHIYPSIKEPGITEMGYDCGGRADRWAALSRNGAGVLGVNGEKEMCKKVKKAEEKARKRVYEEDSEARRLEAFGDANLKAKGRGIY